MVLFVAKRRIVTLLLAFFFFSTFIYAQTTRPIVTDINAYPSSTTKIFVSWQLPTKTESLSISGLLLYRDTKPFVGQNAVSNLKPIATLAHNALSYTDTISDFREYYYAVISLTKQGDYSEDSGLYYDEELDKTADDSTGNPYIVILPGVNATVNGVRVKSPVKKTTIPKQQNESSKEKIYTTGELREEPLPYLDLLGTAAEPEPRISKDTEQKALALVGGKQTHRVSAPLDPYLFEEDLISPAGGDEYLLYDVLRSTFVPKNYPAATAALTKFLALNRNDAVTKRANFYLAESYYYCGKYEKALTLFLDLQDDYDSLALKWIESTLEMYDIPASEN
jgi:tetratricopeptide (TPR) repeat protein